MPPHPLDPGDTLAILYTSGTTGLSKGVCCPHAQYFWWAVYTGELLGVRDGDVLMTTLPLFHTNALNAFYQAMLNGATLVVEPRFSASGFMAALARHQATVTYVLGAMVPMLLAQPPSPADRAHKVRLALAPAVPAHFHQQFTDRFGFGLIDGYGSTETNCIMGAPLAEQRPGLMGRLLPGFTARVVDAHDNELPDGEAGELILRADEPFAFATGYFGMADKTVEAWRNLWFHTGDRVVREPDGFYRFMDRMKDAIRRRGENISSYEVEQVLVNHPAVENAAVFPVRSELAEDEVMAAVVLRAGVACHLRGAARFLPAAHAVFRGAAFRGIRRHFAGDRERQGDEVQTARARHHRRDVGPREGRVQTRPRRQGVTASRGAQPWMPRPRPGSPRRRRASPGDISMRRRRPFAASPRAPKW